MQAKYNLMSYAKLLYHFVFCTKYRKKTIPGAYEKDLYAYINWVLSTIRSQSFIALEGLRITYICCLTCTQVMRCQTSCVN